MRQRLRTHGRDERGLALLLTSMMLVPLLAVTAIVVDLGEARLQGEQAQTVADSIVLAVSQDLGDSANTAATTGLDYFARTTRQPVTAADCDDRFAALSSSSATAQLLDGANCYESGEFVLRLGVVPRGPGQPGAVAAAVCVTARASFAPAVGMQSPDVCRTARVAVAGQAVGIRPIGLCVGANAQLAGLFSSGSVPSGTVRIDFSSAGPQPCAVSGSAPGNWGLLDLNGGSNSTAELNDMLTNGYQGEVSTTLSGAVCSVATDGCIPGDPGALSTAQSAALAGLVNGGDAFVVPLYDQVTGTGQNVLFRIVGFAWVKLVGFEVGGSQHSRYLDVEFQEPGVLLFGPCCGSDYVLSD